MLRKSLRLALSIAVFSILTSAYAQQFSEELRPFDFTNDYYKTNGIIAETLVDRKNGADGQSVFDAPADNSRFTNIRITATLPAYSADGSAIYWNYYARGFKTSFIDNESGAAAIKTAKNYPLFVFPSAFLRGTDRQAALIPVDGFYFQNNPIGIAEVVFVEFNNRISRTGQKTLQILVDRNGTSLDGTPIIKTTAELGSLIAEGLVTLGTDDNALYAVAKVIQYPDRGGITPDAFLLYVKQADGQPLAAERHFVSQFECLKNGSRTCLAGTTPTDR
jgi:hypothetical protein